MTTAVQHRRGTTAEHSTFTGLEGEVTIDTTKDTAVIHDGVLAGGYPLAKENLANVTTSGLSSIDGASTASDDKFFIYDQSATTLKTITRAELNNAIEQDALANVAITGGTINGTAIGGTTAAAGAFTTLSASGAVTLSGGTANSIPYLNGSKVLTTGSALTFDGTNFVLNNGYIRANNTIGYYTTLTATGLTNYATTMDFDSVSSYLFKIGGSEQMRLTSTGLGIGTSSPSYKLDLNGSFRISNGTNPYIALYNGSNTGYVQVASGNLDLIPPSGGNTTVSSGNLGIGTSSPAFKLDVAGSAQIRGGNNLLLNNSSNNAAAAIWNPGSSGVGEIAFGYGSEWMRLSNGNLGLGVTPSAWALFTGNLELNNGNTFSGNAAQNSLTQNAYYGSGGWTYKTTAAASRYQQISGAHAWHTAASGTAGNAITFTQAMTLDASGNLGIGTSSPGKKLHVTSTSANQSLFEYTTASLSTPVSSATVRSTGALSVGAGAGIDFVLREGATDYTGARITTVRTDSSNNQALAFYTGGASAPTEKARIDSSGNFGIGTSSPDPFSWGTSIGINNASYSALSLKVGDVGKAYVAAGSGAMYIGGPVPVLFYTGSSGNGTERARIDSSGNLLVGGTSVNESFTIPSIQGSTDCIFTNKRNTTANASQFRFYNTNGMIGEISTSGTSTSYGTSSDYRLKENIQPMTGALAKVAQLKPCTYNWKSDGSDGEGFIAHELAEVVPQCVTGKKDAVDADGKPVYQGIDTSFLVATLTAAIKEQQAIIETLTARVAALESK